MAVDRAAILTDVAGRLRVTEPEAAPAVDMAIAYAAGDIGIAAADLPADDKLLNGQGVPLLAVRIFNDTSAFSQKQSDIEIFSGTVTPRHLYKGADQYWNHLRVNWGIA